MTTKIEWARNADGSAGETWNPIRARNKTTGKAGHYCQKVSPGCKNCYAERMNCWRGNGVPYSVPGLEQVEIYLDERTLLQPLGWRKPRTVFPCSMTDIFAEWVTDAMLDQIFAVMALTPQHLYMVLTKRALRQHLYLNNPDRHFRIAAVALSILDGWTPGQPTTDLLRPENWPFPNVWPGVSAENQEQAAARIRPLMQTLAAKRIVSCEPLLSDINFDLASDYGLRLEGDTRNALTGECHRKDGRAFDFGGPVIDLVIVGGESGAGARPMHLDWARGLRDQCHAAGVSFFFKQWGEWAPSGQSEFLGVADSSVGPNRCMWLNANGSSARVGEATPQLELGPSNLLYRVGKKAAGRLLDGREWNEMPERP